MRPTDTSASRARASGLGVRASSPIPLADVTRASRPASGVVGAWVSWVVALDVGSEFEAVIGCIVEHEALGGGYPVGAAGWFAGNLVAPEVDGLVVMVEVGQGVVGAFESGHELLLIEYFRLLEGGSRAAARLLPAGFGRAGGGSCADGFCPNPFLLWRNFLFWVCAWVWYRIVRRSGFVEDFRT